MHSYIIIRLILLLLLSTARTEFNLFHTGAADYNNLYHDCLYYKVIDSIKKYEDIKIDVQIPYQTIQYCIRPIESILSDDKRMTNGSILSVFNFVELRKQNVTVQDLFSWSAPVDLLELYQQYIETANVSSLFQTFHNCSPLWFGVYCQYTFDLDTDFQTIVERSFEVKDESCCDWFKNLPVITNFTCYVLLECNRGPAPMCLDWHEVCDGQIHCLGSGADESNCFELEINECESDEYRCHNGMCIPEQFLNDLSFYPDCLDVTDERFYEKQTTNRYHLAACVHDPAFRCEDVNYPIRTLVLTRGNEPNSVLVPPSSREEFLGLLYQSDNRRHMTFSYLVLLNAEHSNLTYDCWLLMSCLTFGRFTFKCNTICPGDVCYVRIRSKCNTSTYVIFPSIPVFQSHVLLGYWTNTTVHYHFSRLIIKPDFLCYDVQRCPFLSYGFPLDNHTCVDYRKIGLTEWNDIRKFFDQCLKIDKSGNETHCFHPSLFHCPGTSKCISKHRLLDGIHDCYKSIDETYVDSCKLNDTHRFQCSSENKCVSRILVGNVVEDCRNGEDELVPMYNRLFFENLCNGYTHHLPVLVDGENETDETNCKQWPCDNQYTRCDGAWTCSNGADELNCNLLSKCYPDHHECISPTTFDIICLPLNHSGDGKMDCLGGTDEREYCRDLYPNFVFSHYRCWNETKCAMNECAGMGACLFEVNAGFDHACKSNGNLKAVLHSLYLDQRLKSIAENKENRFSRYKHFTLQSSAHFPFKMTRPRLTEMKEISYQSNEHVSNERAQSSFKQSVITDLNRKIDFRRAWICNRGILFYIGTETIEHCLCPPSYYGDRCQFQSQRVSLTVKFTKECVSNCHGVYGIVFTLVDQNHIIHSYERLTYISTNNCTKKYNLYFLYGSRPKDMTKNYTIHIDAYSKSDLAYYTSWTLPVKFLVLPVNRIAASLVIPPYVSSVFDNCTVLCGSHGHCTIAVNTEKQFCRCDPGWSGLQCTTENVNCDCSPDSHCLGIVNNRSICLCPLYKVGPRCFLHSGCQQGTCKNGGHCGSEDDQWSLNTLGCICPSGYRGTTCEIKDTAIDFSFHDVEISQSIQLYFIMVQNEDDPLINTIGKKIRFDQKTIEVSISFLFNLIFAKLHNEYYIFFQQVDAIYLPHLIIRIKSSQRCLPIDRLLDKHTISFPLLRRAKYYHAACKEHPQLLCLYDEEAFMCICNKDRFANCFYFNFTTKSNCQGRSPCENGGECFQDLLSCPFTKMCVCNECYHGGRCQFTTKGFSLSLDTVLGSQIHQQLRIPHQPTAVKMSIAISTTMLLIGLGSGGPSIIIFSSKNTREVGCGLYIFTLSILSVVSALMLTIKVWVLIATQTLWITNRALLWISCISLDFILRFLPSIGDWLSACVAVERIFVVIKGVHFNKKESKRIAQWVIISVIVLTVASVIHDPKHRQLIDDEEEERTWCVVRYSFILQIYDSTICIIHFMIPFCINLISSVIIIASAARIHSNVRKKQSYTQYLREQLHEHKHLIISPVILVILSIPRFIISFLSGCMKSVRDPWLFLFGYFISFLPSLLVPIIFIFPSRTYRNEFQIVTQRISMNIRRGSLLD